MTLADLDDLAVRIELDGLITKLERAQQLSPRAQMEIRDRRYIIDPDAPGEEEEQRIGYMVNDGESEAVVCRHNNAGTVLDRLRELLALRDRVVVAEAENRKLRTEHDRQRGVNYNGMNP